MQKIVIEMNPTLASKFVPKNFFETVEYIEGKALLRLDFEKGVKIGICDIKMKHELSLKDLKTPDGFTILNILREDNNKYTCLVKIEYKSSLMKLLKLFNVENIIYDLPFIISKEKIVFAFIGENENLKRLFKIIKPLGFIKNIHFQKIEFSEYDTLSCLTERQREIIIAAKKNGYYELPRKITTEELSRKLGISKATLIEHLRKAENRIVSYIMVGY